MSLRDLVRPCPIPGEAAILSYLTQGEVCGMYHDPGHLFDVIEPGRRLDAPGSGIQAGRVLTDGTWVWSGVLSYYVSQYHIQLPERFLRFAAEKSWKIDPSTIDLEDLDWEAFDAVHELRGSMK